MPIVVDTNVFVGACLGSGASIGVVEACLHGEQAPLMGAALLAEYEAVLGRSTLFKKSRLTEIERHDLLDIFLGTLMIAEFDAETRFLLRARRGRGRTEHGLRLLAKARDR